MSRFLTDQCLRTMAKDRNNMHHFQVVSMFDNFPNTDTWADNFYIRTLNGTWRNVSEECQAVSE